MRIFMKYKYYYKIFVRVHLGYSRFIYSSDGSISALSILYVQYLEMKKEAASLYKVIFILFILSFSDSYLLL